MIRMRWLPLLLAVAAPFVGCAGTLRPDIDPKDPDSKELCASASRHLDEMAAAGKPCKERVGPGGKPFEQFCLEKRASNPPALPLDGVRCIARVNECSEISTCWNQHRSSASSADDMSGAAQ